jgi:hypothetical protein
MGSSAVTITPDQAPAAQSGPVRITPDQPNPHGFFANAWSDIKAMPGNLYDALTAPDPMVQGSPIARLLGDKSRKLSDAEKDQLVQQSEDQAAARIQNRLNQGRGQIYSNFIAPTGEMMGVNVPGAEQSWDAKDYAGVAGHVAAPVAVMAATEGISRLPLGRIARTAGNTALDAASDVPIVRKLGNLKANWDATSPKATYPGAPEPAAPAPELSQASALYRGSSSPPDAAAGLGQIPVRGSIAQSFRDPGAPLPATPAPELSQASALGRGASSPADPAAGLGQIPVRGSIADSVAQPQTSAPAPIRRGSLQQMLNESLGAKELKPNVPLRQQMDATNPASGGEDLPEGHTSVKSSALRSYKYDPDAQEFHARATSGDTTYVYGGVSPEDAQAFESADSKGKAWQQIRQNPLVAKIVNGKRIAVKPGAPQ